MPRAFVIVMDACGVGALPDAADYGDEGTNTLGHLAEQLGGLTLPHLQGLGLGSIIPLAGVVPAAAPVVHGRLHALGYGKDSTAGHRELMGLVARRPPPTFPAGFPSAITAIVTEASGRGVICNRSDNGIEAIETFGDAHVRDGDLIVYTSQDSVLQIAAHVDVVAPAALYEICTQVRARLTGDHEIGRVIARPFDGRSGAYARTEGRRDYAIVPDRPTYLDHLRDHGVTVHTVGKVGQLFNGRGIDVEHAGATNDAAIAATTALIDELDAGFVFTNLIETDQVYGHRKDFAGFAGALERIDDAVGQWRPRLRGDDLLVLTADHGVDLTSPRTDHTREHVPLLAVGGGHGHRHDGPLADVGATVLRWLTGADAPELPGGAWL